MEILTLLLICCSIKSTWNLPIQVPGQRREPFQYWLPVASHNGNGSSEATGSNSTNNSHKNLFMGEPLIASANSINPRGFDFMKLLVVKRPVHVKYTQIVPLVWVDLPLFDTPTFRDFEPHSSSSKQTSVNFTSESESSGETTTVVNDGDIAFQDETVSSKETNNPSRKNSLGTSEKVILANPSLVNEKETRNGRSQQEPHNWSSLLHHEQPVSPQSAPKEQQPTKADALIAESRNQVAHVGTLASQPTSIVPQSLPMSEGRSSEQESSHPSASYNFSYEVSDQDTRDVKSHKESRQGDVVQGEYSVLEPDGYTRVVTYTADADGFRAKVKRIPPKK